MQVTLAEGFARYEDAQFEHEAGFDGALSSALAPSSIVRKPARALGFWLLVWSGCHLLSARRCSCSLPAVHVVMAPDALFIVAFGFVCPQRT